MPASSGLFSVPAVRSPLGQEAPVGAEPLLPSPEIRTGRSEPDSNTFNFMPPGLDDHDDPNGSRGRGSEGAAATGEARPERSPRNPFYHADTVSSPVDGSAAADTHTGTDVSTSDVDSTFSSAFGNTSSSSFGQLPDDDGPGPGPDSLAEFNAEGYNGLEKIYIFTRSKVTFHRVFIAKSLGMYLHGEGGTVQLSNTTEDDGQQGDSADAISPDDAVRYVLPLLYTLATDEGRGKALQLLVSPEPYTDTIFRLTDEAVKEALASELVPIIWWFITRCKLVDEEVLHGDYFQQDNMQSDSSYFPAFSQANSSEDATVSTPPPEVQRSDSESAAAHTPTSPEPLLQRSASSPDSASRHVHHHNPLTVLAHHHNSPSSSPHATITALPPLPQSSHTPDHPSPLGQAYSMQTPEATLPAADEPALIRVSDFTPVLGTLLLSANSHVGGPARYAVVELLRRVRKADDFEHNTATQLPSDPAVHPVDDEEDCEDRYSNVGLFVEEQRRIFEKEMIHQVVIGMGQLDQFPEEPIEGEAPGSGFTTTAGTPQASGHSPHTIHRTSPGAGDSYFPLIPPPPSESHVPELPPHHLPLTSPAVVAASVPVTPISIALPSPPTTFADFAASGLLSPPLEMTASPSPSVSSSPFFAPSPAPTLASSIFTTPSLTSGSSFALSASASPLVPTPSSAASDLPVPSDFDLAPQPPSSSVANEVEGAGTLFLNTSSPQGTGGAGTWIPPRSPGDLPMASEGEKQAFSSGLESTSGVHQIANWVGEDTIDDSEAGGEAAVGKLSSMSLMAAVTASGE